MLNGSILIAQNEKCGTFRQIERYEKNKTLKTKQIFVPRPEMQKSILTINNKIRIHFDTIGIHQPAMVDASGNRIPNSYKLFIDTLQNILDSVWKAEIETYNFNIPPSDNGRGGGNEYDFYVMNISDFGITNIEDDLPVGPTKPNRQFASFIQIDNDFGVGYRTKGVPALMATCAHEFHHAIQVGGSGVWESEYFYFYELCAEAMENTVFKDAKDYIFDVKTYFIDISTTSLFQQKYNDRTAGYERALWGMFLMKKYGTGIMKAMWDEMSITRPVMATQNALNKYSTSLEREFSDFTYWNFYTGYRSDTSKYYSDANIFPMVSFKSSILVSSGKQDLSLTTKSFSANYIKASTTTDTAFVIVSNTNVTDALDYSQQTFPFKLSFSTSSATGFPKISTSVFAQFQVDDYLNWSYIAIGTSRGPVCFPNPFNPSKSSLLIALQGIQQDRNATLNIFSSSTMDLIFSGHPNFKAFSGTQYAEWSGRDNKGNIAASGIYTFILSNGIIFNKGKFAVIR
ncbi:MAG TPA: hypothetical protein DCQ28_04870 [Bacteroidetes bacterium]|nr:hypothetical protein [Bacteroidota bacterium]